MPTGAVENNINNSALQVYLKNFPCEKLGNYTHTSIGRPTGSYNIAEDAMKDFYDIYHKSVFIDKIPTHLTEGIRDCPYTPLKIDIDFRYYSDKLERKYTMDDILEICKLYMKFIEQYLIEPEKEEREFFIMEKTEPTYDVKKNGDKKTNDDGLYRIKDGVHIIAPRIVCNFNLQHQVRTKVCSTVNNILDKYGFDNSYTDIFDKCVIDTNNWQMYGSSKPFKEAYKVTKIARIYETKTAHVALSNYNDRELIELLSMRNKKEYSIVKPEMEAIVFTEENTGIPKKKIIIR